MANSKRGSSRYDGLVFAEAWSWIWAVEKAHGVRITVTLRRGLGPQEAMVEATVVPAGATDQLLSRWTYALPTSHYKLFEQLLIKIATDIDAHLTWEQLTRAAG